VWKKKGERFLLVTRPEESEARPITDGVARVVVIVGYMGKEETRGYGYSLLMMLAGSMVLQLVFVFVQNRKKPWAMAKEMLVVITGVKAPW